MLAVLLLIAIFRLTRSLHLHAAHFGNNKLPQNGIFRSYDDGDICDGIDAVRRAVIFGLPPMAMTSTSAPAYAAAAAQSRDVDVGGGFDLLEPPKRSISAPDATFPPSMIGDWICQRTVVSCEGDTFQATQAWRALGGSGSKSKPVDENFMTRFISAGGSNGAEFVVVDRGFELSNRAGSSDVKWSTENPSVIQYGSVKLAVVQRSVEPPSDKGFGSNELYRIDDGIVMRAAQVKRRFRRAFDGDQNRIVEGLELVKTFRVLDGVAGTEFPTSVTKSMIRLTRP